MKKVISSVSLNSSVFVRKLFSRTSLRSNPSSDKCHIILGNVEIEKLTNENQHLQRTISSLKDKLDRKDATIGDLAREKEVMYIDLRKYRRTIRNIQQELDDERIINSREKEYLRDEINAMKMRIERRGIKEEIERMIQIENENKSLKSEAEVNVETIYNLCIKYLRLKSNKDAIKLRLEKLNQAQDQALADVMISLDRNREQLNDIITEKIKTIDVAAMNKKYFMLIDKNNKLQYENASIKIKLKTLCNYLGKQGHIVTDSGDYLAKPVVPRTRRGRLKNGTKTVESTKCKSEKIIETDMLTATKELRTYNNDQKYDIDSCNYESQIEEGELNSITTQSSLDYQIKKETHHRQHAKNVSEKKSKSPYLVSKQNSKLDNNEILYFNRQFIHKTSDSQIND